MIIESETVGQETQAIPRAAGGGFVGSELKRLALHSSHYLAGLLGGLGLGLVSFPIFTRVFSIAEYGVIDLGQKVMVLLTIASKVGLQNAALRFYDGEQFAADRRSARSYYSTMFFGVLVTSTGAALLFLTVVGLAPKSFLSGVLANLIHVILALSLLRAVGSILWSFLRIEERTKAFNAASVGTKAATVVAICALLPWAGRTAGSYFAGMTLVEAALVVGMTVWLLRRGVLTPTRFDLALFRCGIVFGMPLVVYEVAFAVLASADRFLVRHYLGADALGLYSVAYGMAQHVNELLLAPLFLALVPIYMRLWTSEGREKTIAFLTLALDLFLLAAVGILAVVVASAQDAVILLASSKYAAAGRLIPVLLAGLLIYATHIFVAAGLLIYKRTLQMAGLLLVAGGFDVGLNWLLLPRLGLMGGALATFMSYSFCILLLGRASRRLLPLRIHLQSLVKYVAAAGMASLAGSPVELGQPALNLLCKSALTVTAYGAGLYALDGRVRRAVQRAVVWCRGRS